MKSHSPSMGMPLRRTPVVLALLSFSCDYLPLDSCLTRHPCTWTVCQDLIFLESAAFILVPPGLLFINISQCNVISLSCLNYCCAQHFFKVQFILSVNTARKMFRCCIYLSCLYFYFQRDDIGKRQGCNSFKEA